jgi:hypothetical protein
MTSAGLHTGIWRSASPLLITSEGWPPTLREEPSASAWRCGRPSAIVPNLRKASATLLSEGMILSKRSEQLY